MNRPPFPPPMPPGFELPSPPTEEEEIRRMEEASLQRTIQHQEAERRAMFASPVYDADFWRMACIAALTGVKMGLANKDAVAEAVKAADDALDAFRKRFRRTENAPVVALHSVREP